MSGRNGRLGLVGLALVSGLAVFAGSRATDVAAQPSEVVWYRWVTEGRSAGTMPSWQRVGAGAAATFPFMEGFEVQVRPEGDLTTATVIDGQSRVSAAVACAGEAPRRAMLRATRAGSDLPTIRIALQCSATEPSAR